MDDRKIGFIQGVIYAAALMAEFKMDSEGLLAESNISKQDLVKYGEEQDLKKLGLINED